jgi:uridine kinase
MPYEVPIYANRMLKLFEEWTTMFKDNPLKADAYERSARVYNVLKHVTPVDDESAIPGDSVLREFIGGSTMDYH